MKKALYLHGMGGSGLSEEVLEAFIKEGLGVTSPTIDYRFFLRNPHLFKALGYSAAEYDFIIGNSMGGFLAYHLAKAYGKVFIGFNPALSHITTSHSWFNVCADYVSHTKQKPSYIFLSTNDYVVDHIETQKFLEAEDYPNTSIYDMEGLEHSLNFMEIYTRILSVTSNK